MKRLTTDSEELVTAIRDKAPYRFPNGSTDYLAALLRAAANRLQHNEH